MTLLVTHIKYCGTLMLAAAGILLLVVGPTYHKAGLLQEEIKTLADRVADGPTDHAILQATEDRVERLGNQLQGGTREIPDASDVAGIVSAISSDVSGLGLTNAKLNRGKETSLGNTASVGLNVETTGQFDVVVQLLQRIESLPRLVRISTFAVKPIDSRTGEVSAMIGLDAYYRVVTSPDPSTAPVSSTTSVSDSEM